MSEATFLFRLDAFGKTPEVREEIRRYYWELMTQQHTPLINQLNLKVAQHPHFSVWRSNNAVDNEELKKLWQALKGDSQFKSMPGRALVSARLTVQNTFNAWLALQQNRNEELNKLLHSLEVLKTDTELVAISGQDLNLIISRAKEVLNQVNIQLASDSKTKKSKKATEGSIYKILYDKHGRTEDLLEKCAIAYLLKNRFKIEDEETEENLEKLSNRIHSKEKQIEILQNQLENRLPKGRPWVGKDILDEIRSVGIVDNATEWNAIESALLKQQSFMPHPIVFHSSDDLVWFDCESSAREGLKTEKGTPIARCCNRVGIRFKGFDKKYAFQVSGDHRHLHILQQALRERVVYDDDKNENTSKLFLVRSATLIWKEYKKNENRLVRRRKVVRKQSQQRDQSTNQASKIPSSPEFYDPEFPWNRYQLFLHCTIETLFLSKEGTELFIQKERHKSDKALKTLEERVARSAEEGEPVQTRKAAHSRKTGTLRRLNSYDNNYERPSKPLYAGHPHILTGVALGSSGLVTVTIVDATSGKFLDCQGLKSLLGDNYKLVNRRQLQRQRNLRHFPDKQKRRANTQFGESNLGDAIDRHTAKAIVNFAKAHQSGCIVLPDMKNYRAKQQSAIAALAERECSGWKGIEKQFAKAQNMKIHSWSYGRLIKYISDQATKDGILVKIGRQPIDGSSQEKAGNMAIASYQNKATQPKKFL